MPEDIKPVEDPEVEKDDNQLDMEDDVEDDDDEDDGTEDLDTPDSSS